MNKYDLEELRETYVCLKIIHRSKLYKTEEKIIKAKKENNELISIRQLVEVLKLHREIFNHK